MRIRSIVLTTALLLAACGEQNAPADDVAGGVNDREASRSGKSASSVSSGDPCAPLEARMVRHDTRGKPLLFSFEMPQGFEVNEFSGGSTAGVDLTIDPDGKGGDDYVLRFAQNTGQPLNPSTQVELWRKLPMLDELIEHDVDGRTMFISRSTMGEMVGYQALFPSAEEADVSWLVIAGITSAPKECRDEAVETVERILKSFERNPQVVPASPDS